MLCAGTMLGNRYRIRAQVGRGGMAAVYCADDTRFSQVRVAVKRLDLEAGNMGEKEVLLRQFQHEADILRRLKHANIPRLYEIFDEAGEYYLVMDFVEGRPLDTFINFAATGLSAPATPTPEDVVGWALQIGDALAYLHAQKPHPVIYKDLKPGNLVLTPEGTVMLLDFGIAKATGDHGSYSTLLKGSGTRGYSAPEQFSPTATDGRADLYSLGATMYSLLASTVPCDALARQAALAAGKPDPLPPLSVINPEVSPPLEAVVTRLMAVPRAERFQAAEEVLRALRDLGTGGRGQSAPPMAVGSVPSGVQVPDALPPVLPPRRTLPDRVRDSDALLLVPPGTEGEWITGGDSRGYGREAPPEKTRLGAPTVLLAAALFASGVWWFKANGTPNVAPSPSPSATAAVAIPTPTPTVFAPEETP